MGSQTSLPSNPGRRKRRDQGHLSFPSTIGECTPPPQILTPNPALPTQLPRAPAQSRVPVANTHGVTPARTPGNCRGGWSEGPYNWYGPGWLDKRLPCMGNNRGRGTGPWLGSWGEWGEGPRGKERRQLGNSSGRSTTTNRQPASGASQHNGTNGRQDDRGSQLDGEGPQHNGTNRRQNDRGSQLDGEGPQPSLRDYCPGSNGSDNGVRWAGTGDRNPSVASAQRDGRGIHPHGRGPQLVERGSQPRPNVSRPGGVGVGSGAGRSAGEGGQVDASSPTGPLLMNTEDNRAPEKLFRQLQPLTDRRLSDSDWNRWCSLLERWTQGFSQWSYERSNQSQPNPQSAWARRQRERRSNGRQPNNQQNRNQTRNRTITRMVALQKAYRQHPKQCMAMIRKTPPPTRCTVPITAVGEYFQAKQRATNPNIPTGPPPPIQLWDDVTPTDLLEAPITPEEVLNTLKRSNANSAPGPNRLQYSAWKRLDPGHAIITAILNTCRINAKVPPSWKRSTTILIHKGDDVTNLDNWRPIALQNTLYKVYTSIITRRVSSWAIITNKVISPSQKGFLPYEGCLEHGFVLKSILQDSRRHKKEACIAWLDLRDAFGSVLHSVLLETLKLAGLRGRDVYTNSLTV